MKLEHEIKQKAFQSPYQKAHINILFTASWLSQRSSRLLKPYHISWQQFNILRILRGMHPEPATVKELTERMIDKMSNASRLVEKLYQKGLVDRKDCPEDRRRGHVYITPKGLDILEKASKAMESDMHENLDSLTLEEAEQLNAILDKLRG